MYSPLLNRFTSRDPEPEEGQPDVLYGEAWVERNIIQQGNAYVYARNRPSNYTDPSGLKPTPSDDDPFFPPIRFPNPLLPPFDVILDRHGRYCGLGHPSFWKSAPCKGTNHPKPFPPGNNTIPPPVDDLDKACLIHDCCLYPALKFIDPFAQKSCNEHLCDAVKGGKICDGSTQRETCLRTQERILALCATIKTLAPQIFDLPIGPGGVFGSAESSCDTNV